MISSTGSLVSAEQFNTAHLKVETPMRAIRQLHIELLAIAMLQVVKFMGHLFQLFQGNGKSVITFTTSVPNEEVLDGLLRAEINFPSKPTKIDAIKTVLRRI